ncbi:hypothetical protein [Embleya sp. NBC_00896]|uniref:hypothetical protein n=1 Tax=Embleya sp. NBC_00896 TaxID=2975961 RepID=UPI003863D2AF|nr:hypothetical protein OG928_31780 [Embleya sp. NBC_00896]
MDRALKEFQSIQMLRYRMDQAAYDASTRNANTQRRTPRGTTRVAGGPTSGV